MQNIQAPYVNCHFCNARLSVPNAEAPDWKGGLERSCENISTYKRRSVQPYALAIARLPWKAAA
jgi:hypothetical protein